MSKPFRPKGCKIWYIRYYRNGKKKVESSGSEKKTVAQNLLKVREGEIRLGSYIEPANRKVTVDELFGALLANYRYNEAAILEGTEQRWGKRLEKHFGGMRALAVTTEHLNRYITWCREQAGLANATINRDLAALRRAFRLAVEARQLPYTPRFPRLKEAAPRSGFVEQAQYDNLAANARELWLRALLAVAYAFGCQVDLLHRTIRLNPGETKNDEGRVAVMTAEVYTLLEAAMAGKKPDDFVFTRQNGKRVRDFRERWAKLVAEAGCNNAELLFHDLRRSAVRNMIRRGVPAVVAMRISGHKTRDVFDRYNIVSETDLVEAARKIEAGEAEEKARAAVGHRKETPARQAKNRQKYQELHQSRAIEAAAKTDVTNFNAAV